MEPWDSLFGERADDARVIQALQKVEPGRERIIVRKDGIVVLDLLGEPETMQTPTLTKAQEALIHSADVFHNHPPDRDGEGTDTSFSVNDLYFARKLSPGRLIAVAQTRIFEIERPLEGWRKALGSGRDWEREFRGFFALEYAASHSVSEARHQAWVRLCRTRRILYVRRSLE